MCLQWAVLAMSVIAILSTVAKPLAPPPTTTGWLYNYFGVSFIFPFTATECEPFDIFYNTTANEHFYFYDETRSNILLHLYFPKGIGYFEWICNIPAGIEFNAGQNYTVQPGSSSSTCLGNITTTYSHLDYFTSAFESYTRNPSLPATSLSTISFPTTAFPTDAYPTITLNPNLAVISTTSPPSSSSPITSSTSPPSPTPSPKSRNAAVAGGVVGAVAFVLLILTLVLWRRRRHSVLARASSPIDHQPSSISELATGQLGSTDLSSPFRSSGTEFLGGTQQYPFSPLDLYSHRTEPTSNNPIDVPVTGYLAAHVDPIVGQGSSQGAIIPSEADSSLPSQWLREAPDSGHQASSSKLVTDLAFPADPQPPSVQLSDTPANTAPETSSPNPTLQLRPPSTTETQDSTLDFATILGAISRSQLSPRERQVIASANNLLIEASSASSSLARQNTTASSPPPYTD